MKRIWELFQKTMYVMDKPQKILGVFIFILTCIGSVLECLGVSVIIPLVSVIQDPDSIMENYSQYFPFIANMTYKELITTIVGGVIFLYLFKNAYFIFLSWIRVKYSCKIQREMSVKMLSSYLSRGYQFFLDMNFGKFNRYVAGDASEVYTVLFQLFRLVAEVLTIILIVGLMLLTDLKMALIVMALALFCLALIYFVFRKMMFDAGIKGRKYAIQCNNALVQAFEGVKDVLLLRKQLHFINEFEKNNIEAQKAQCRQTVGSESPAYVIEGICISGIMAMVGIRVLGGASDAHFIAVLSAFAVGAFRVLPSLGKISSALNLLTAAAPNINAMYDQQLKAEKYSKEHPEAQVVIENLELRHSLINKGSDLSVKEQPKSFRDAEEKFKDCLELKNISFRYTKELGYVLKDINLKIKKGSSTALIGASGAGKSTLVDVLLGLLIPQEGCILMDGEKITDIPHKWAETIGYVPQAVFLSDNSIRENVAFGEDEDEIDINRVYEALERAELKEFIDSLPEGIETQVGKAGVKLSGGQRQRIAIARALYHRPEILVLDEATSALDNDTESAIMSAIDSLQGQVTLIIVAHRLTTVRNCDVIYEVSNTTITQKDKAEVLSRA